MEAVPVVLQIHSDRLAGEQPTSNGAERGYFKPSIVSTWLKSQALKVN